METNFNIEVEALYNRSIELIGNIGDLLKANKKNQQLDVDINNDFTQDFFNIINKVNLNLIEDKDNFFGYFLFQILREIRFDINSPTAINFKNGKYVIYFNPILFLKLDLNQMQTSIKHEIMHVLSSHLVRANDLKGNYSKLAINMSMDVAINQYLNYLPPYFITLESVNTKYLMSLEPYKTFEYYLQKIQTTLNLQDEDDEGEEHDTNENDESSDREFDIETTHDIWEDSDEINDKTLTEMTKKIIDNSQKGSTPYYLQGLISSIKNSKGEIPWNLYLKKMMGTIESDKKKTISRRSRRQPYRLDLRGQLRAHKPNIAVAIDISGSISDEEFKQAIKEVLAIVKNYNSEITIIECDNEIRNIYKVKSERDLKERSYTGGETKFTPVFDYANKNNFNLLIYFTDGKGENKLKIAPRGYQVLWVLTGSAEELSVERPYGEVKKLKKVEIKRDTIDMNDVRMDGYSMNSQQPIL